MDTDFQYLWDHLCHQHRVTPATYAAFPFLTAYCQAEKSERRILLFQFLVIAELSRHRKGAPPLGKWKKYYLMAIESLKEIALDFLNEPHDEVDTKHFLAGLAMAQNQPRLAWAILMLEPEIDCPECGAIFPPMGYDLFQ